MRRVGQMIALGVIVVATMPVFASSANSETATVSSCAANAVVITEYNINVATSKYQELFWIRNDSARSCSLRGFVRVTYIGNYSPRPTVMKIHPLVVGEVDSYTPWGGERGGLAHGLAVPTVVLSPRVGVASFWITGVDGSFHRPNGRMSRCTMSYEMRVHLPGESSDVTAVPMHAANFDTCGPVELTPILAGRSGSDPALPLSKLAFSFPAT
jgi:hypothetical protein